MWNYAYRDGGCKMSDLLARNHVLYMQPEILSVSLMTNKLREIGLKQSLLCNKTRDEICNLFKAIVSSKPQRTYRLNRRGKLMLKFRRKMVDTSTDIINRRNVMLMTSKPFTGPSNLPTHSISSIERIKPPPLSYINTEKKIIRLSGRTESARNAAVLNPVGFSQSTQQVSESDGGRTVAIETSVMKKVNLSSKKEFKVEDIVLKRPISKLSCINSERKIIRLPGINKSAAVNTEVKQIGFIPSVQRIDKLGGNGKLAVNTKVVVKRPQQNVKSIPTTLIAKEVMTENGTVKRPAMQETSCTEKKKLKIVRLPIS